MDELESYVIRFLSNLMNETEQRAHEHLLSAMPLNQAEQRLKDGIAWEEAKGNVVPDDVKSYFARRYSRLSNDREVLRLTSGGLDAFLQRRAKRIQADDRDKIVLNDCPRCGALARTPQALQCRRCGRDWLSNLRP
jgi:ribosomal protein L40E